MQGLLVIISAPSGGGKDAVIAQLVKRFPNSTRFVTTTTRPLRNDDTPGVNYNFISTEQFEKKIKNNEFFEYAQYAGNYYGSDKKLFMNNLLQFNIIFLIVDVKGKRSFDKTDLEKISIFLLPESLDMLKKRIERRGGIKSEVIEERLKIAKKEIKESKDYDYRITNFQGRLKQTVAEIEKIINNELRKRKALDKMTGFR